MLANSTRESANGFNFSELIGFGMSGHPACGKRKDKSQNSKNGNRAERLGMNLAVNPFARWVP
jgi:hypothetical protein